MHAALPFDFLCDALNLKISGAMADSSVVGRPNLNSIARVIKRVFSIELSLVSIYREIEYSRGIWQPLVLGPNPLGAARTLR